MKKVDIIGLKINEQFGIIQACEMEFDPSKKIIAVKGEVGAGKTSFQKALRLVTQGSSVLSDKSLYGKVNAEVQLTDGEMPLFISCKSSEDGKLKYVLYTKDKEGKKVSNPIIDGVQASPAKYLSNLQTELTWGIEDIISENKTTQRNTLLTIYKKELEAKGVILDKKDLRYKGSVLHGIDKAIESRTIKDVERKSVFGYHTHILEKFGIDVQSETDIPKKVDTRKIEEEILAVKLKKSSYDSDKENQLLKIKEKVNIDMSLLHSYNKSVEESNRVIKEAQDESEKDSKSIDNIKYHLESLYNKDRFSKEDYDLLINTLGKNTIWDKTEELGFFVNINNGVLLSGGNDLFPDHVNESIKNIIARRGEYKTLLDSKPEDFFFKLKNLEEDLKKGQEMNRIHEACTKFLEWRESDKLVKDLKQQYYSLLATIETGVEGLFIDLDEDESLYLSYDGSYDPNYFNNPNKEKRKLASYSGTQKPVICLLIQNFLLSKLPKSMRYIWIDDVPIDNKTKALLEKMGEELDLTVFVNITGDFNSNNLDNGEILIENGEVFFKRV